MRHRGAQHAGGDEEPIGDAALIDNLDGACVQTARARHGAPIILTVDAAAMHATARAFYQAVNGVRLTDHAPPCYLSGWPG